MKVCSILRRVSETRSSYDSERCSRIDSHRHTTRCSLLTGYYAAQCLDVLADGSEVGVLSIYRSISDTVTQGYCVSVAMVRTSSRNCIASTIPVLLNSDHFSCGCGYSHKGCVWVRCDVKSRVVLVNDDRAKMSICLCDDTLIGVVY